MHSAFAATNDARMAALAAAPRAVTLANGMTVIVWPDRDVPSVALYNFVRAGSRNEVPGTTGLAHFFEHMMFNGTSRRAPGEFDRIMEAAGGSNNASTSEDLTIYQDWFPTTALEAVFELEADRLRNLAFVPEVVESERNVVYSERRLRTEDDTEGRLMEQVQASAFLAHPYGNPTIGWPSDILSWSIEDLQKFFGTYYAPNNCTLVLAGDVDPEQVFSLARKYLEPIPAQAPPPPIRTQEPEQQGERRVHVYAEAQTPLLQFAYHSLAAADPDMPAFELLMRILTDGDSSRLHRALVEQQKVAIAVDGYWQEGFDPGLAWFFLTLPADGDDFRAETAFTREIEAVARDGITAAELNKAKSLVVADFWRSLATINGRARALGTYAVLHGDYLQLFEAPQRYEEVTAEKVKELAARVLAARNRTIGILLPAAEGA
ncbi:MAG TPA: pitrilysin family protein [Gammaproteobacteria bacterium]|jgi:zinc protease